MHRPDVNAQDADGDSALWWAEQRVAHDAAPPAAGAKPVTAAQRKLIVAMLKGQGAA